MSNTKVLGRVYLKKETLQTLIKGMNSKDIDGIEVDFFVDDKPNKFNQNVSLWVSQTKEEQEAKKTRFYVGNGAVNWSSDGSVFKPERRKKEEPVEAYEDDIAF